MHGVQHSKVLPAMLHAEQACVTQCDLQELGLVKAHLAGAELGQEAHRKARGSQVGHLGLKQGKGVFFLGGGRHNNMKGLFEHCQRLCA
jgi:hypothetical protein